MNQQTLQPKQIRQRKFFMALPLLALPFLTLSFWVLGGGQGHIALQPANAGFNTELPNANLKDDPTQNKLSLYEQAEKDSAKLEELMKNDPYYNKDVQEIDTSWLEAFAFPDTDTLNSYTPGQHNSFQTSNKIDANEAKVYQKLNRLQTTLDKAATTADVETDIENDAPGNYVATDPARMETDKLNRMMETMNSKQDEPDPELQQINGLMDKILDVQHPERVRDRIRQQSEQHNGQAYAVTASTTTMPVSLLQSTGKEQKADTATVLQITQHNAFYGMEENTLLEEGQNAIEAVVHETQILVSGATVKLRLINDIYVNGTLISKGNFVYGIAQLNGERLTIEVSGIRYSKSLLPVSLSVYDIDGLAGIYIPGAITRDVAKQSVDQSIQSIGIGSLNPSLGVQAASAGIDAAKTLLSRRVKQVKVTVKAGYHVLLRDNKQKEYGQ